MVALLFALMLVAPVALMALMPIAMIRARSWRRRWRWEMARAEAEATAQLVQIELIRSKNEAEWEAFRQRLAQQRASHPYLESEPVSPAKPS